MNDPKSIRKTLAERLRAARKQAGLSQGQVAKLLNYQRPTISEIEAGRRRVSAEELPGFARIYGVTIVWLTDDAEPRYNPSVELAARELTKLKSEDLNIVLQLLQTLKKSGTIE